MSSEDNRPETQGVLIQWEAKGPPVQKKLVVATTFPPSPTQVGTVVTTYQNPTLDELEKACALAGLSLVGVDEEADEEEMHIRDSFKLQGQAILAARRVLEQGYTEDALKPGSLGLVELVEKVCLDKTVAQATCSQLEWANDRRAAELERQVGFRDERIAELEHHITHRDHNIALLKSGADLPKVAGITVWSASDAAKVDKLLERIVELEGLQAALKRAHLDLDDTLQRVHDLSERVTALTAESAYNNLEEPPGPPVGYIVVGQPGIETGDPIETLLRRPKDQRREAAQNVADAINTVCNGVARRPLVWRVEPADYKLRT